MLDFATRYARTVVVEPGQYALFNELTRVLINWLDAGGGCRGRGLVDATRDDVDQSSFGVRSGSVSATRI